MATGWTEEEYEILLDDALSEYWDAVESEVEFSQQMEELSENPYGYEVAYSFEPFDVNSPVTGIDYSPDAPSIFDLSAIAKSVAKAGTKEISKSLYGLPMEPVSLATSGMGTVWGGALDEGFGNPGFFGKLAENVLAAGGGLVGGVPGALIGKTAGRVLGTPLLDVLDARSDEELKDILEEQIGYRSKGFFGKVADYFQLQTMADKMSLTADELESLLADKDWDPDVDVIGEFDSFLETLEKEWESAFEKGFDIFDPDPFDLGGGWGLSEGQEEEDESGADPAGLGPGMGW